MNVCIAVKVKRPTNNCAVVITRALENDVRGPMNATAPHPARQAEFASALVGAVGRRSLLNVPGLALRLLGGIASEILNSKRVLPEKSLAEGFRFAYPDLEGALAAILDGGRVSATTGDRAVDEFAATNERSAA